MGKLVYMMVLIAIIEFAIFLFIEPTIPGTSLYNLIMNPQNWDNNTFWGAIDDVLLVVGTLGIVAGLYFIRNEWIVYAGLSAVFISFGSVLYQFWQEYAALGIWGDAGNVVLTMFMLPLIIAFIMIILDYSRGKD